MTGMSHTGASPMRATLRDRAAALVRSAASAVTGQRLARFAVTGAFAGVVQLALLAAFLDVHIEASLGDVLAFFAAAQVNFVLSQRFTWRDRPAGRRGPARWFRFMALVSLSALLNLGVFTAAILFGPPLVAAALGIAAAAIVNFIVADRAVFAACSPGSNPASRRRRVPWLRASP
jgi:putative flippase GtrA